MFNLYQMIGSAQGGQGLDTLARQFGLTREQADGAVQALVPALSTAFTVKAAQPGGFGEIAAALGDAHHRQAFADPAAAQSSETGEKGGSVLGSLFGNDAIVQQVVKQAAQYTGLPEATLAGMLPVIVSMILGGVSTALHEQGLGAMLGQLAKGGIGGLFGQFGGAATGQGAPGNAGGGSFPGMLGNILNSFLGGAHSDNPQEPVPQTTAAPGASPAAAAGLSPMMQAGLDMLGKMFEAGVPHTAAQPSDLGDRINASHAGNR